MSLTTDDVRHVARLARLALTDQETQELGGELSAILGLADRVREVATPDVPPTSHPYPLVNVLRTDDPRPSLPQEEAVSTAPSAEDGRFRVPRMAAEGG